MKTTEPRRRASGKGRTKAPFNRGLIAGLVLIVILAALVFARSFGRSQPTASGQALTNPANLAPAPNQLAVGTAAPDFDLATTDGQHYRLSSLRGQPVLLEFYAVWCPHCQAEAPVMTKLSSTFGPKGLKVLSILASPYGRDYETSNGTNLNPATAADLAWYAQTFAVTFPMLIDPTFATVNQYGINSYPTIYLVDGNGIVRYVGTGEVAYDTLSTAIAPLTNAQ